MSVVAVSKKWQVVIPKAVRERIRGLKPGGRVEVRCEDERIVIVPLERSVVSTLYGLGADVWKGIDPVRYQRGLREEWEEPLSKS